MIILLCKYEDTNLLTEHDIEFSSNKWWYGISMSQQVVPVKVQPRYNIY